MQIQFENVSYTYMPGTPFEEVALENVSCTIPSGMFVTVLGKTGSGKTTALQLIKGLLKPSRGRIIYTTSTEHAYKCDKQSKQEKQQLNAIWSSIGYLFQYPEHQLFEETVERDISYGPRNLGVTEGAIKSNVLEAMEAVGLSYEQFAERSPFALSGGQMRRVAIAGVLASKPQTMILDEPMAGLDPISKTKLIDMLYQQHLANNWTTICVSHHIDEIWQHTDHFLIFNNKRIEFIGSKQQILQAWQQRQIDIEPPSIVKLALLLIDKGIIKRPLTELSNELQSSEAFARYLGGV